MNCYEERAHLLALIAQDVPAGIYRDPEEEEGFQRVLALKIGDRWLTWHIADSDLYLFPNVAHMYGSMWDGYTTREKYEHIRSLVNVLSID